MTAIEEFIYQFEGEQREILLYLHGLLTGEMMLGGKMRYKIPFYDGKSWICYLNPGKKGGIEFAFVRGNELSNEQGILESKDRKQVTSIQISQLKEIPEAAIREILQEAILLDESTPYASKRTSRNNKTQP